MTELETSMDPRVLLAMTLIGLGVTTIEKLKALWKQHGASEADLDAIMTEVQARIDRRG